MPVVVPQRVWEAAAMPRRTPSPSGVPLMVRSFSPSGPPCLRPTPQPDQPSPRAPDPLSLRLPGATDGATWSAVQSAVGNESYYVGNPDAVLTASGKVRRPEMATALFVCLDLLPCCTTAGEFTAVRVVKLILLLEISAVQVALVFVRHDPKCTGGCTSRLLPAAGVRVVLVCTLFSTAVLTSRTGAHCWVHRRHWQWSRVQCR